MNYRWFIDGETVPLTEQKVSVGDLAAGAHRAVLFVDDGLLVIGDTLLFVVPKKAADEGDGTDTGGDTSGGEETSGTDTTDTGSGL
jgi:hypothetical protein